MNMPPTPEVVPSFTKRDDGTTVLNDPWPEVLDIRLDLLAQADPAMMHRDGDRVRITVANGEAVYQVCGQVPGRDELRTVRLYARYEGR